ncbi:MAG: IS6 family transposase, partial [Halobacterium sp.]
MLEIARLNEGSDCFELDFLEREATPEPAMKLGIRLHLAGLSLSDTVSILDRLGVERCRTTVHNWVQKADLQPIDGADPDHVAVDETVIQLNDERFWLYAAVDSDTNRLLHVKPSPTRNQAITEIFLAELRDKQLVDDAVFLVDSAPWLQAA